MTRSKYHDPNYTIALSLPEPRLTQLIDAVIVERPDADSHDVMGVLLADWSNAAEHVTWLETAPVGEIVTWASDILDALAESNAVDEARND